MDIACQHTERVLFSRLSTDRRLLVIKSEHGKYFNELFEIVIKKIGANRNDSTTNISIPNKEAAIFLSKSRLSREVLRSVWNIAKETHDNPDGCEKLTAGMDLSDFFTAVKLIQLHQNGYLTDEIEPTENFIVGNVSMEAPFFDGYRGFEKMTHQSIEFDDLIETEKDNITHTVMEEPSKQQYERRHSIAGGLGNVDSIYQRGETRKTIINNPYVKNERRHSTSSGLGSTDSSGQREKTRIARINDPYYMSSSELGVYGKMFDKYKIVEEKDHLNLRKDGICDGEESEVYWDGSGGYMYITQALKIFLKAKISQQDIGVLWDLVASEPNVERFNRAEFSIVMHLVKCISKKKLSIPGVLPSSLSIWKNSLKNPVEMNSERESFETLIKKAPASLSPETEIKDNSFPEKSFRGKHVGSNIMKVIPEDSSPLPLSSMRKVESSPNVSYHKSVKFTGKMSLTGSVSSDSISNLKKHYSTVVSEMDNIDGSKDILEQQAIQKVIDEIDIDNESLAMSTGKTFTNTISYDDELKQDKQQSKEESPGNSISQRDTPSLSTNADEEADTLSNSQEVSLRIEKVEANVNDMQNTIDCISKSNDSSLPLQICSSCESLQGITSSLGSEIVVLKCELTTIKGVEEKNKTEIARVKNHINKMKEKQKISESTLLDLQKSMKHVIHEKGKLEANLEEMQSGMMLMRSVVDKLTDELSLLHQK